jgi:hypothetical protein
MPQSECNDLIFETFKKYPSSETVPLKKRDNNPFKARNLYFLLTTDGFTTSGYFLRIKNIK